MADTRDVVVDIKNDELVSLIHQKLRVIDDEPDQIASPTIYRVVPSVREMGSGAYDPKVISIGPFHRMKEALQPMERVKWRFLRDLIRRSSKNSPEKYIQKLRSLEGRARSCYSEQVVPDGSNTFVEMMLLDACFIIELLVEWYSGDDKMALLKVNWNLPLVRNDLLLLENQIPFCVLQSLYDLTVIPSLEEDGRPITLTEVAFHYVYKGEIDYVHPSIPSDVHHLLHLFHSSLLPTAVSTNRSEANQESHPARRAINRIKHIISYCFFWFLSLILYCRRPPPGEVTSRAPRMIPSATELEDAGVEFKRKEANCILDVTFRNGTMEMPLLSIEAATIPLFRNLIAFEQCCPTAGSHFTAYSALMYFLIDKPEDVALLASCGILDNQLDSNQEVAGFFQSLSDGAYLDYENQYLVGLFRDVNNYRASEIHKYRAIQRWRAMLMHDYFSKPWAIISLIAAFVLLILTMVQTFFAVLAYYHPPS